jgi:hypothetical protein
MNIFYYNYFIKKIMVVISILFLYGNLVADEPISGGNIENLSAKGTPLKWYYTRYVKYPQKSENKTPTVKMDNEQKHSNDNSFMVETTKEGEEVLAFSSKFKVTKGETYNISCWIKNEGGKIAIRKNPVNKDGRHISKNYKNILVDTEPHAWKYFEKKVGINNDEKFLSLTVFFKNIPGKRIWLDDVKIEKVNTALNESVMFRMAPNYDLDDNIYYLPAGQPMICKQVPANEAQHKAVNPKIVVELPEGIEMLSSNYDANKISEDKIQKNGSSYIRYVYTFGCHKNLLNNLDFSKTGLGAQLIVLKSNLSPSATIKTGYIHYKDDSIVCNPCPFKLKTIPAIKKSSKPEIIKVGVFGKGAVEFYGKALEDWCRFYGSIGFNHYYGSDFLLAGSTSKQGKGRSPAPIYKALKRNSIETICWQNRIINGYMIRYTKLDRQIPDNVRLFNGVGKRIRQTFDPPYIYRKGEWFIKAFNNALDLILATGTDHIGANWEPYRYKLIKGSFSENSMKDFAIHAGEDYSKIKKLTPQQIIKKYPDKIRDFQAWQFGEVMKTYKELIDNKSKEIGRSINFLIVTGSPMLLDKDKKTF